jgi:hypothetical protein
MSDTGPRALAERVVRWLTGERVRARLQRDKNAGIAKILVGPAPASPEQEPDHAGMGIIIDPLHVITCAHVVNAATGNSDPYAQERPSEPVRISFPMLGEPVTIQGKVCEWRAAGQKQHDDIAVLELDRLAPEQAGVAMLADGTGMPTDGDELSIFGVAAGDRLGNHIDARFKGSTSAAWVQIDGVDRERAFIEGGFSGAAVWDYPHSAALGMMVAKSVSEKQRVAYMIPAADLRDMWPALEIEHRPLSAPFARTWTAFSAVYFLLLLAHWAVNRGISTFSIMTVSGDHPQLASFWGMHVYALLAPVLLLMLISFANAFRLHDWIRRVPSFGAVRGWPISSSTSRTAAFSLAAFVVLPLAAQIHFIRNFHDEGYVYVAPSSFGYTWDDPVFTGQKCDTSSSFHLCTKSDAGRYSLAEPKPGAIAHYWNNAYHYGDRGRPKGSVTFFPIFQPVAIIALTVLSAGLSALALFLVFRPPPDRPTRWRKSEAAKATTAEVLTGSAATPAPPPPAQ